MEQMPEHVDIKSATQIILDMYPHSEGNDKSNVFDLFKTLNATYGRFGEIYDIIKSLKFNDNIRDNYNHAYVIIHTKTYVAILNSGSGSDLHEKHNKTTFYDNTSPILLFNRHYTQKQLNLCDIVNTDALSNYSPYENINRNTDFDECVISKGNDVYHLICEIIKLSDVRDPYKRLTFPIFYKTLLTTLSRKNIDCVKCDTTTERLYNYMLCDGQIMGTCVMRAFMLSVKFVLFIKHNATHANDDILALYHIWHYELSLHIIEKYETIKGVISRDEHEVLKKMHNTYLLKYAQIDDKYFSMWKLNSRVIVNPFKLTFTETFKSYDFKTLKFVNARNIETFGIKEQPINSCYDFVMFVESLNNFFVRYPRNYQQFRYDVIFEYMLRKNYDVLSQDINNYNKKFVLQICKFITDKFANKYSILLALNLINTMLTNYVNKNIMVSHKILNFDSTLTESKKFDQIVEQFMFSMRTERYCTFSQQKKINEYLSDKINVRGTKHTTYDSYILNKPEIYKIIVSSMYMYFSLEDATRNICDFDIAACIFNMIPYFVFNYTHTDVIISSTLSCDVFIDGKVVSKFASQKDIVHSLYNSINFIKMSQYAFSDKLYKSIVPNNNMDIVTAFRETSDEMLSCLTDNDNTIKLYDTSSHISIGIKLLESLMLHIIGNYDTLDNYHIFIIIGVIFVSKKYHVFEELYNTYDVQLKHAFDVLTKSTFNITVANLDKLKQYTSHMVYAFSTCIENNTECIETKLLTNIMCTILCENIIEYPIQNAYTVFCNGLSQISKNNNRTTSYVLTDNGVLTDRSISQSCMLLDIVIKNIFPYVVWETFLRSDVGDCLTYKDEISFTNLSFCLTMMANDCVLTTSYDSHKIVQGNIEKLQNGTCKYDIKLLQKYDFLSYKFVSNEYIIENTHLRISYNIMTGEVIYDGTQYVYTSTYLDGNMIIFRQNSNCYLCWYIRNKLVIQKTELNGFSFMEYNQKNMVMSQIPQLLQSLMYDTYHTIVLAKNERYYLLVIANYDCVSLAYEYETKHNCGVVFKHWIVEFNENYTEILTKSNDVFDTYQLHLEIVYQMGILQMLSKIPVIIQNTIVMSKTFNEIYLDTLLEDIQVDESKKADIFCIARLTKLICANTTYLNTFVILHLKNEHAKILHYAKNELTYDTKIPTVFDSTTVALLRQHIIYKLDPKKYIRLPLADHLQNEIFIEIFNRKKTYAPRPEQLRKLRDILNKFVTNDNRYIYEIVMGYGKSSVINVLLTLLFLSSKQKVCIVTLDSLLTQTYAYLCNVLYDYSYYTTIIIDVTQKFETDVVIISDTTLKEMYVTNDNVKWNDYVFICDEIDMMVDSFSSEFNMQMENKEKFEIPNVDELISIVLGTQTDIPQQLIEPFSIMSTSVINVNFGLLNQSHIKSDYNYICMPYSAANTPTIGSEFSDMWLTILLTIKYYVTCPLTRCQLNELFDIYTNMCKKVIGISQSVQSVKDAFNRLMNINGVQLCTLSLNMTTNTINDTNLDIICNDIHVKIKYLKHVLANYVNICKRKKNTSFFATMIEMKKFIGYTGTPYVGNLPSHVNDDKCVTYKTLSYDNITINYDTLFERDAVKILKCAENLGQIFYYDKTKQIIYDILDNFVDNMINCLIDTGAFYVDSSPENVGINIYNRILKNPKYIIDTLPTYELVYIDKAHNKKIMKMINPIQLKNSGKTITITDVIISDYKEYDEDECDKLENRIIYFDHAHITGQDIQTKYNCVGLITIDTSTKLRDLEQGAFRLRNLPGNQNIKKCWKDIKTYKPTSLYSTFYQTDKSVTNLLGQQNFYIYVLNKSPKKHIDYHQKLQLDRELQNNAKLRVHYLRHMYKRNEYIFQSGIDGENELKQNVITCLDSFSVLLSTFETTQPILYEKYLKFLTIKNQYIASDKQALATFKRTTDHVELTQNIYDDFMKFKLSFSDLVKFAYCLTNNSNVLQQEKQKEKDKENETEKEKEIITNVVRATVNVCTNIEKDIDKTLYTFNEHVNKITTKYYDEKGSFVNLCDIDEAMIIVRFHATPNLFFCYLPSYINKIASVENVTKSHMCVIYDLGCNVIYGSEINFEFDHLYLGKIITFAMYINGNSLILNKNILSDLLYPQRQLNKNVILQYSNILSSIFSQIKSDNDLFAFVLSFAQKFCASEVTHDYLLCDLKNEDMCVFRIKSIHATSDVTMMLEFIKCTHLALAQKGGNYKYYKTLYLETRNICYKKIYKHIKYD